MRASTIATFALALCENIYCVGTSSRGLSEMQYSDCVSALIAFFIWKTHHDVRQVGLPGFKVYVFTWSYKNSVVHTDRLQPILRIFIESAGAWVLFILVTFMMYLIDENSCYIFLYLVCLRFHAQKPTLNSSVSPRRAIPSSESPSAC